MNSTSRVQVLFSLSRKLILPICVTVQKCLNVSEGLLGGPQLCGLVAGSMDCSPEWTSCGPACTRVQSNTQLQRMQGTQPHDRQNHSESYILSESSTSKINFGLCLLMTDLPLN